MEPSPVPLWKWLAVTAIFTLALTGAYALGGYAILNPTVVHKHQLAVAVKQVAGDQNIAAQCEAQITAVVNSNFGQIVAPFRVVSVKQHGDSVDVTVKVSSTLAGANGNLTCAFRRSNWQLQGVHR